MKVRELKELLQQQDEDAEVRVVVEGTDRKIEEDVEFEIDKVVRENCGYTQVNIMVW